MTRERNLNGHWLVAGIAAIAIATVAYFAVGMPGMDHGPSADTMTGMNHQAEALGVDRFDTALEQPGVFVINVHTPPDAAISGTDLVVPYDEIDGDPGLPADRSTPILLYCKTGSMSAQAARSLLADGFTDVRYLAGGTDAWVASGRPLPQTAG
ncbi:MAG TPA: rhodanese-like domain-containing protein [Ilumatobacter sp.]|nr:rhodanese-like domain-containing protein [Ilumatobacter sp.]